MKIAFYCRVGGQSFGFVLPDEADKLREFSPSIRISLRLRIHQAQAKNFCRVLDIRVAQVMKAYPWQPRPFQHPLEHMQHAVRGHGASCW